MLDGSGGGVDFCPSRPGVVIGDQGACERVTEPQRQFEVVKDAGRAMKAMVAGPLGEVFGKIQVTSELPEAPVKGVKTLSVYLFEVGPDPEFQVASASNQDIFSTQDEHGNTVEVRPGRPLYLRLRFLLSAWTGDSEEEQAMLGLVLRTFHDRPYVSPEYDASGTLYAAKEAPRVDLDSKIDLELQKRIFGDGRPFRPVIGYRMRVRLDSAKREVVRRVRERIIDFNKIEG